MSNEKKKKQLGEVIIIKKNEKYIRLLDKNIIFKSNNDNVQT